eukprot:13384256-Heterocapsa_arctica.AAC.1
MRSSTRLDQGCSRRVRGTSLGSQREGGRRASTRDQTLYKCRAYEREARESTFKDPATSRRRAS